MYGIYANIWGIWMVNVTIYNIHGSYGYGILYIYIYFYIIASIICQVSGKYSGKYMAII